MHFCKDCGLFKHIKQFQSSAVSGDNDCRSILKLQILTSFLKKNCTKITAFSYVFA